MRSKVVVAVVTVVLSGMMAAPAVANFSNGPDEAGVVERFSSPFGLAFEDADAGLVALGGPPPEQGCVGEGFEDYFGDFQAVSTAAGPVILVVQAEIPFYVYEATSVFEVCEAVIDEGRQPIAAGENIAVRLTDNFANYEPGSRSNPFGANANGTVYDAKGDAWSFHASQKFKLDRDGNFTVLTEKVKLSKRGR
jgi:hypothetical protein